MKQSRLKFRVRSLLLLMTSIALTLGYLAMRAGRVVELQQHVESLGGSVTSKHDVRIDAEVEYVPDTAPLDVTRGSLPKGWLVEPVGIDLSWSDANDADVARIAKTEQLEGISLDGTDVTDEAVRVLATLPRIRSIGLSNTGITDVALQHLSTISGLEDLDVSNTTVSDEGLRHLEELHSLKNLNLVETGVTEAGYMRIQAALPNCIVGWW